MYGQNGETCPVQVAMMYGMMTDNSMSNATARGNQTILDDIVV